MEIKNTNSAAWRSPSNIALVKYWGKKGFQLPSNASISFTLKQCHTETTLYWSPKAKEKQNISVWVDGVLKMDFLPKVEKYFNNISKDYPQVLAFDFKLETQNTFPHSSGIASSASGMSALSLCVVDFITSLGVVVTNPYQTASYLSRIGSGSACRSIYGGVAMWGEHPNFKGSSDDYAIEVNNIHALFCNYHDDILIVHEGQKSVSSSVGHGLLDNNPFSKIRFETANQNMVKMQHILAKGDLDGFVELVESEALMLHALMMTSSPSFVLMKPNTLAIIEAIRLDRADKNHHICFTLDAGANVHMLYPEKDKEFADKLIQDQLVDYCENGRYIRDGIGNGPKQLNV